MTFETDFKFSVDVKWISEDKVMDSKLLSKTVSWTRVDKPTFYVEL